MSQVSVGIVGLGLIGASLARALEEASGYELVGFDKNPQTRAEAAQVFEGRIANDLSALGGCGIVVLATPVSAMGSVTQELGPYLMPDAVLTDVGSMKVAAIAGIEPHLPPGVRFVPGHPIAGLERHGPLNSKPDLFVGHRCVLTPGTWNDGASLSLVEDMWVAAGMSVTRMDAQKHDEILGFTSHLPHLLSYAMARASVELGDGLRLSAGSYRDYTRIAASDPDLWANILVANRESVLKAFRSFANQVDRMNVALERADESALAEELRAAQRAYLDEILPLLRS